MPCSHPCDDGFVQKYGIPRMATSIGKNENGDKSSSLKRHMFRQTCPELIEFIGEIWEIIAQIPSETIS
jgi:hypothetical protein